MKSIGQWVLFKYVGREFTPISKPFKTRQAAERARAKLWVTDVSWDAPDRFDQDIKTQLQPSKRTYQLPLEFRT